MHFFDNSPAFYLFSGKMIRTFLKNWQFLKECHSVNTLH